MRFSTGHEHDSLGVVRSLHGGGAARRVGSNLSLIGKHNNESELIITQGPPGWVKGGCAGAISGTWETGNLDTWSWVAPPPPPPPVDAPQQSSKAQIRRRRKRKRRRRRGE